MLVKLGITYLRIKSCCSIFGMSETEAVEEVRGKTEKIKIEHKTVRSFTDLFHTSQLAKKYTFCKGLHTINKLKKNQHGSFFSGGMLIRTISFPRAIYEFLKYFGSLNNSNGIGTVISLWIGKIKPEKLFTPLLRIPTFVHANICIKKYA